MVAMHTGRTSFDVTGEPLKEQLEAFLDEHRAALHACLDGLTEEQARRSLVPSRTTLLGLVKHVTYAERVWFGEAVTGRPRQEMGLPPNAADAFILADGDTIESVRRAYAEACQASRQATADLGLDDVLRGHRLGPLPLRWVYLHALREFAQHCGHADILREQILGVLCKSSRYAKNPLRLLPVRPVPTARAGQEGLHSQPVLHNALSAG